MAKDYRTDPPTLKRARDLRREMTDAERKLWRHIRDDQLEGNRFRRQVPVKPYILDFCCLKKKLAIEVDGGQHAESSEDLIRIRWLERRGYQVLRFWNNDVLSNVEGVLETVLATLRSMPSRF
jgi:primosomal protein N' (replication factor Y)